MTRARVSFRLCRTSPTEAHTLELVPTCERSSTGQDPRVGVRNHVARPGIDDRQLFFDAKRDPARPQRIQAAPRRAPAGPIQRSTKRSVHSSMSAS